MTSGRSVSLVGVLLGATLVACTGILGGEDPSGEGRPAEGTELATAPPTPVTSLPLRRLSRTEYANTIRDLVGFAAPAGAQQVSDAIAPILERVPKDARVTAPGERRGGFHRLDQDLQQTHADVSYALANELGRQLTSTPERRAQVFGECITGSTVKTCIEGFVRRFGERALRRAVTEDDVAFYTKPIADGASDPAALADVVALILAAPDVFYVIERNGDAAAATRPLSAYELASRLSYHFWQTLPDEELFAAARSGDLAKDDVYAKQVERLAKSPRARAVLDELFGEWLRLDELDRLDTRNGDPIFDAFVGRDVPTADLRANMFSDVLEAAAWVTGHGGTVATLLQNRQSFAKTADVAAIYGVEPWDGRSEPPTFPDAARAGLVTRAAFLATGSANTRPIMKGVRIRMGLLCDSIPPPPPNAAATHVALSPTATTREVVETLTEGAGSSCAGCHAPSINPLGFATENFDALGRIRAAQRLFSETGALLGERPVDTRSVPRVALEDVRSSTGAADLVRFIVESKKVESCFARNYFRFAFHRNETSDDEQLIELIAGAATTTPIAEIISAIALRPEFKAKIQKEQAK